MGILVGIGVSCGATSHSLIDSCTVWGIPLFGPFMKRRFWIVPRSWRTEVGDKEKEEKGELFQPTKIEKRYARGANLTTAVFIIITFAPSIIDFVEKYGKHPPS